MLDVGHWDVRASDRGGHVAMLSLRMYIYAVASEGQVCLICKHKDTVGSTCGDPMQGETDGVSYDTRSTHERVLRGYWA